MLLTLRLRFSRNTVVLNEWFQFCHITQQTILGIKLFMSLFYCNLLQPQITTQQNKNHRVATVFFKTKYLDIFLQTIILHCNHIGFDILRLFSAPRKEKKILTGVDFEHVRPVTCQILGISLSELVDIQSYIQNKTGLLQTLVEFTIVCNPPNPVPISSLFLSSQGWSCCIYLVFHTDKCSDYSMFSLILAYLEFTVW